MKITINEPKTIEKDGFTIQDISIGDLAYDVHICSWKGISGMSIDFYPSGSNPEYMSAEFTINIDAKKGISFCRHVFRNHDHDDVEFLEIGSGAPFWKKREVFSSGEKLFRVEFGSVTSDY